LDKTTAGQDIISSSSLGGI